MRSNPAQLRLFDLDALDEAGIPSTSQDVSVEPTRPVLRLVQGGEQLFSPPHGEKARIKANLDALRLLIAIEDQERQANTDELRVLSAYSAWGGLPQVFDHEKHADVRQELIGLLGEEAVAHLRRGTLNAHFTDPRAVRVMWDAVVGLGWHGEGKVLEPGCGIGVFGWHRPAGTRFVGVELDPTSARIARLLVPDADIRAEGFEHSFFGEGSFAVAIGNVPFGNFRLHDPAHNPARFSIHNHFLAKAVQLVAPGGLVVMLTSRWFMDARRNAARRTIYQHADLLGAVRLWNGAMEGAARTQAILDLVILRKRLAGEAPGDDTWLSSEPFMCDEGSAEINAWFVAHPECVIGTLGIGRGLYSDQELMVAEPENAWDGFRQAVERLVNQARERSRGFAASVVESTTQPTALGKSDLPVGCFSLEGERLCQVTNGGLVPVELSRKAREEVIALVRLRDALLSLIQAQHQGCSDERFLSYQQDALKAYESYQATYGPINRFTRVYTQSGTEQIRRPNLGGFRDDPLCGIVLGAEDFDAETGIATPAPIFFERVLGRAAEVVGVESAEDGLAVSLTRRGKVDLPYVAELTGDAVEDVIQELAGKIYFDPALGGWVEASEYLSGDVVTKLELARAQGLEVNVAALERVQPEPVEWEDLAVRPGASWIDGDLHEQFAREVLKGTASIARGPDGQWTAHVRMDYDYASKVTYGMGWGSYWSGLRLFCHAVTGEPVVVTKQVDNKSVVDQEQTMLAREKQAALIDEFVTWCGNDPGRRKHLASRYNALFNRLVTRRFDGSHLELPGLARNIEPYPHQRGAIWRIVACPTVLLAHPVGAGKTLEMIAGGVELKRLGLIRLPLYVVPNHLVEQFVAEFQRCYPGAVVAVIDARMLDRNSRIAKVSALATHHYDAAVVSQSVFARIPMSRDWIDHLAGQFEAMVREQVAFEREGGREISLKHEERRVLSYTSMMDRLLATAKDAGLSFEELGVDYLFVDEAHAYKNLFVLSANRQFASAGSARALDLWSKITWLRAQDQSRIATFATATPVANSLAEVHTMLRFLAPDVLSQAEVLAFDPWLASFAVTQDQVELSPEGGRFRVVQRISRYENVPELQRMLLTVMDCFDPNGDESDAFQGGDVPMDIDDGVVMDREVQSA